MWCTLVTAIGIAGFVGDPFGTVRRLMVAARSVGEAMDDSRVGR
jgi:hypothetical protein